MLIPCNHGDINISWKSLLLKGLALYLIGVAVLFLTRNPNIFPAVTMIGASVVPAAYVAYFYDHRYLSKLRIYTIAKSFFFGGILGIFAAALLEPVFIGKTGFFPSFEVGLIEEASKVIGVLAIAYRHRHNSELDGLILGAAAGMGFAALESSGYAFSALIREGGSLPLSIYVTLLRGVFAPLGHGTWTAILVSVLFRESAPRHWRINAKVVGAYLLVSMLHGLWNGIPSFLAATPGMGGSGADILLGQVTVGGTGMYLLWLRWREAVRLQEKVNAEQARAMHGPLAD